MSERDEFEAWWAQAYGQILTLTGDADADATCRIAKIAARQAWEIGRATVEPVTVPTGWKLVPVEPTREMWDAVNKMDDEMAAGSYDCKGCSIEQAWHCLLAAAPATQQHTETRGEEMNRYSSFGDMTPMTGGEWVRYSDHCEAMKRVWNGGQALQRAIESTPSAAPVAQGLTDEQRRAAAKALVEVYLGFPAPDREPGEIDLRAVDVVARIIAAPQPSPEPQKAPQRYQD